MKYLRYILLGVCVIAILLVAKNFIAVESDHEHDHEATHQHEQTGEPDDSLAEDEGHSHEQGDHTHESALPIEYSTQDDEDQEDDHDAEGIIAASAEWEKLIGLRVETVQKMAVEAVIQVPGQIIPNGNQIAVVNPFLEASVNCIFVNVGDRVKANDELACLTSPEIGILRAEYNKAKAEHEIKTHNYQRKKNLFQENVISEKVFQEAELEMRVAEVNYEFAMKKLLAVGLAEEELDHPPEGHSNAVGSTIHLYAPISGVITARHANIGQKVNQSTQLFEIINLQTVWCEADIFEKDLQKVHLNQKVNIQVSAYQDIYFSGHIFFISSILNSETKTTKILIEIHNESEKLKPGMFANTQIVVGKKENTMVLPTSAILQDEMLNVVFVKESSGYHRHVIETGIVSGPHTEILSGIDIGDQVVTQGHYQLMSKWKMQGVDPHAGHVH